MGKDSLIKSTAKKAGPKTEEDKTKKKTTKKAAAGSKAKKTVKKQTKTAKTTKSAKPTKKRAAAKSTKKPTVKELLFKKFDSQKAPVSGKATSPDFSKMTAPPLISSNDPKEVERLRELLTRSFSMAQLKVATEQRAKAEAEAKAKAEAEAKAKADSAIQTPATAIPSGAMATTMGEPQETADATTRLIKIGVIAIAALALLIVWTSARNNSKYYLVPRKGAVEIWKGLFSPTGKEFFAVLHGVKMTEAPKSSYSRKDVFPLIFDYNLDKADALLEVTGLPDYKAINEYLDRAAAFAINGEMSKAVKERQTNIQRLTLLYKIEVDMSKGTAEALQSALQNLKKVERLTNDPAMLEVIKQNMATVTEGITALEAQAAEEKTQATEQTEESKNTAKEKVDEK